MLPKRTSASYFYVLLHARACLTAAPAAAYLLTAAAASSSAAALSLSPANIFPLPSFAPFQYGGELPSNGEGKELHEWKGSARKPNSLSTSAGKGECWSAVEVSLAAAQQWGGTGDTLMTTEEASLAFCILKKSYLQVRPRAENFYGRGVEN